MRFSKSVSQAKADLPTLHEYTELGNESRAKLEELLGSDEGPNDSPEIPGEESDDADAEPAA